MDERVLLFASYEGKSEEQPLRTVGEQAPAVLHDVSNLAGRRGPDDGFITTAWTSGLVRGDWVMGRDLSGDGPLVPAYPSAA
eukprot:gene10806-16955_t